MTAAFQANAFQSGAFQLDGIAVETTVSRGGFWPHDENVERARERAWRAARKAARELRRTLEKAFDPRVSEDRPEGTETAAPAVRRSVELVERELAAAEVPTYTGIGPLAAEIRRLRRELMQLLTAHRMNRQALAAAARHAERVYTALLDEEAAIVTLLM